MACDHFSKEFNPPSLELYHTEQYSFHHITDTRIGLGKRVASILCLLEHLQVIQTALTNTPANLHDVFVLLYVGFTANTFISPLYMVKAKTQLDTQKYVIS